MQPRMSKVSIGAVINHLLAGAGLGCFLALSVLIGNAGYGLSVAGQRNLIVRNHAQGNAPANYPASHFDNAYGTIVESEAAMNAAANENVNWSF